MNWTHDGQRWALSAAPRYAVGYRGEGDYPMFIDGHEVDSASTDAEARGKMECVYEYEEHGAELALARLRLSQARARLAERYPRAAGDPQLLSILEGLGDALGVGPEAGEPEREPDAWRCQLEPDLWLVVDASQCIVLEVTTPAGRVVRRVTVGNPMVVSAMLTVAQAEQRRILTEADNERVMGIHDRRRAEGRLTKSEAVEWLVRRYQVGRNRAIRVVRELEAGAALPGELEMTYSGGYWVVPTAEAEGSSQS